MVSVRCSGLQQGHAETSASPYDDENFGFQTTSFWPRHTGLPCRIFLWSDWRPAHVNTVRVEVEVKSGKLCPVSVEDLPKKLASWRSRLLTSKSAEFIVKNRAAIEEHWRGETDSGVLADAVSAGYV